MIFAIGDIHGMLDPLKVLSDYIYQVAVKSEPNIKLVFTGDYIDCGPSSKQVLDLILQLKQDFDTTTLLGNHEEMLLCYYHKKHDFLRIGNYWLNFNGGLQTIQSFYPQSLLFRQKEYPDNEMVSNLLKYEDIIKLEDKYITFFNELKVSYQISLPQTNKPMDLLFSHSVPSLRHPLESQLEINSWQDLRNYMEEANCELDETIIWNRQLLSAPVKENMIVIHGHTPTRYYRQVTKILKFWEDEENAPFVGRDKKNKHLTQIDIDTGLIYGGALTMLAIDDSADAQNVFPYYISVDIKKGLRSKRYSKKDLDLS
jgi:serine/threonine protein phosphatase 1